MLDLSAATKVLGTQQVAPGGVRNLAITPAAKTLLLDVNDRAQLTCRS